MMRQCLELFFFIQLIKISLVDTFTKPCNASLETVSIVASCPKSRASYHEAKQQKNCSALPLDKTGCESFQYHCVLSENLNTLVEVCAPSLNIIGNVCAKFSSTFKSIVRVDNQSCNNSKDGCPFSYNSTMAFLYQQCYSKVYNIPRTETQTTKTTSKFKISTSKGISTMEHSEKNWIAAVIVPIILCILGLTVFILWKRYKRRNRKDNDKKNGAEIEPLANPDQDVLENDDQDNGAEIEPFRANPDQDVLGNYNNQNNGAEIEPFRSNPDQDALENDIDRDNGPEIEPFRENHNQDALENDHDQDNGAEIEPFRANPDQDVLENDNDANNATEIEPLANPDQDVLENDNDPNNETEIELLAHHDQDVLENESGRSARIDIDVSTDVEDKRILLECAVDSLIDSLKYPNKPWTEETIKGAIDNLCNKILQYKDRKTLMYFVKKLNNDPEIKKKLRECEVEMHDTFLSIIEEYDARNLSIYKGSVCFVISFLSEKPLQRFLGDIRRRNKDFIKNISKIFLCESFLGIFQIPPEIVTWKTTGMKIYKGSDLLQEEYLEVPIVGTYKAIEDDAEEHALSIEVQPSVEFIGNTTDIKDSHGPGLQKEGTKSSPLGRADKMPPKLDGEEDTEKHAIGVFRFVKLLMAVAFNLTQILRDLLEIYVPHAKVETAVKFSEIYKNLSREHKEELSKAVQSGYGNIKIPLLYELLKYLCFEVLRPTEGWDTFIMPETEYVSVGDDIERIRLIHITLIRKTWAPAIQQPIPHHVIGTNLAAVSPEYFDKYWTIISDVCKRMQSFTGKKYAKSLKKIHEMSFEGTLIKMTPEKESKKEVDFMPKLKEHTMVQEESIDQMITRESKEFTHIHDLPTYLYKTKLEQEIILDNFRARENRFPAYRNVKTRELSFASCEDSCIKNRAWKLARDGFFYEGYGAATTCFNCGLTKDDWKEEDDIHKTHKTFNESCIFMKYVQWNICKTN